MNYFDLSDDVTIPERWHLGEIHDMHGIEPPALFRQTRYEYSAPLVVDVGRRGRALDFSLTSFARPLASQLLAQAMAAVAGDDLQCLPIGIVGHPGALMFLHSTRIVRCLDESRSEWTKWTPNDHRADLAGSYRQVIDLTLDVDQIPSDAHFFRVWGWEVALIVSEVVKDVMESTGCLGARFTSVMPSAVRAN